MLEHWKAKAKVWRAVTAFVARPVVPQFANRNGGELILRFDPPEDGVDRPDARVYRAALPPADVRTLIDYLINPGHSVGFFMGDKTESEARFENHLAACGIQFNRYRHPNDRIKGYAYCQAVNTAHALHRFTEMSGLIDPGVSAGRIEVLVDDDWINTALLPL